MSVSGLCEICARGEAEHTCMRCGTLACDEHFDTSTDMCEECTAEVGGTVPDSDDLPDGVDTYRL